MALRAMCKYSILLTYTLLDQLVDTEMQSKPLDDAMVINEPVKLVAGSSKHPNDMDVVDCELVY